MSKVEIFLATVMGLAMAIFLIIVGSLIGGENYDKQKSQIRCLELEIGKDKCDQIFEVKGE